MARRDDGLPMVRVNLLPTEIKKAEQSATQRRLVVLLMLASVAVVAGAVFLAALNAESARRQLTAAEDRAAQLVLEHAKYADGQRVANQILATGDAQRFATAAELAWAGFIRSVLAATPPTVGVQTIEIEAATPLADGTAPSGPLEGERLGSIRLGGVTANYADAEPWVRALAELDGYVGSTVQRVELVGGTGYGVIITVYFSDELFFDRFDLEVEADTSTPTPTPTTTPESEG